MSLTILIFSLFHSCVVGACLWVLIPLHSFGVTLHILGYFHASLTGGRMFLAISLSLVICLVLFLLRSEWVINLQDGMTLFPTSS